MAKRPDDDLFSSTTMSFGAHLEELRVVLFRSLFGLVFGFLIGLWVSSYVVNFMQGPLKSALDQYYIAKAKKLVEKNFSGLVAEEMLATMLQEGLIPDDVLKIEVEGFLRALKEMDPEHFANVKYKPHRFVPSDVIGENFSELCAAFKEKPKVDDQSEEKESEKPDKVSDIIAARKLLWSLMSPQQHKLVERLAAVDKGDNNEVANKNKVKEDDQWAVIQLMNQLSDNPKVHQSEQFKKIGANKVRKIRNELKEEYDADLSMRLNRFLISSVFSDYLQKPRVLLVSIPTWKPTASRVQALGAHEAFMIWLKAGFISGLVIASPWIFWNIWHFVGAGLYPHEKNYVFIYLPFSLLLFLAGAAMAFFLVFEPVLKFLFSFNQLMEIDPDPRISEWLGFVMILPLGFGVSFQLPLVMLFLNRVGIFSVEIYLAKWRIAILVIFVISMLLTPADPISMLLMAMPLTILYFSGVALCRWMPRGRNPFTEVYEP